MMLLSELDFDAIPEGALVHDQRYGGWRYEQNAASLRVVTDDLSQGALPGGRVLEFQFPAGFAGGVGPGSFRAPAPFPDPNNTRNFRGVFVGFHFASNAQWDFHGSNVNKVAFFWRSNTIPSYLDWNDWNMLNGSPSFLLRNDDFYANFDGGVPVSPGRWFKVEVFFGVESAAGAGDGTFRVWVDGVLQNEHTNIPNLDGYISNFYFDPVWGGIGETKATNDFMRIDCLRLSAR